jgi:hypothetical protein
MIKAARLSSLLAACLLVGITLRPEPGRAAETTAAGWYHDCQAYIGLLRGTSDGDDLEITYCMGQTLGIIEGLRTGSRIGALSMASLMAVLLGLDREQVFDVFKDATTEDLLGYCAPPEQPGSSYIEVVADYLDRNPASLEVSATAAFFEALREAYPCAPGDPAAPAEEPGNAEPTPAPEAD